VEQGERSLTVWFTEKHTSHSGITMEVREGLFHAQSPYQTIDILDTFEFGKVLLLDGLVMLTERDEFVYHEMLAHVPIMTHPHPKKVLIIGGGDGGTVREVLKHKSVESITLVEIDRMVVKTALDYLPQISSGLNDPKTEIVFDDGARYLKKVPSGSFDIILVDSTDPIGPARSLFSKGFFKECSRILTNEGIFASQTESPFYHLEFMKDVFKKVEKTFRCARFFFAPVITYPSGTWSFILGFKGPEHSPRLEELDSLDTKYYSRDIHSACFAMPRFLAEELTG
jgi:spermidine synthase